MTGRQQHHQHQRRPPDVEEALSSMLWTPYERTPTDSSSEDDDEKLNRRLRKSRSCYDYPAANIVASATAAFAPMTASYFGCDDLLLPTTHFVPFSDLSAHFSPLLSAADSLADAGRCGGSHRQLTNYQQPRHHQQQQQQQPATNRTAAEGQKDSGATTAVEKGCRFSYPHYGPLPSLTKWWSSSTTASAREPPTYESLYSRNASSPHESGSRPVLRNLRTTVKAISSRSGYSSGAEVPDSVGTTTTADGPRCGGRLVHSFTDNFADESFSASLDGETTDSNETHLPTLRSRTQEEEQQQRASSTCHYRNEFLNNVAEYRCEQERKSNNNDVTNDATANAGQQQSYEGKCMRQTYEKHKESKENNANNNNNYYCDGRDCIQNVAREKRLQRQAQPALLSNDDNGRATTSTEQVNQLASVPLLSVGTARTTATTTAMNAGKTVSTTTVTTTAQQMNSPTNQNELNNKSSTATTSHNHNANGCSNNKLSVPLPAEKTATTAISSSRAFAECVSSFCSVGENSLASSTRRRVVEPVVVGAVKSCHEQRQQQLTPNKCLAELERLRAEIHASESHQQQQQQHRLLTDGSMRLNVPATVAVATRPTATAVVTANASKYVPTTSSVFLTTTTNGVISSNDSNNNHSCGNNSRNHANNSSSSNNCAVAILTTAAATNRCQRQPSLTIQVNNNNNNVVSSASAGLAKQHEFVASETTVNSNNSSNNNGISVVSCGYVQRVNSSSIPKNGSVGSVSVNSSNSVPLVLGRNSAGGNNGSADVGVAHAAAAAATTTASSAAAVANSESVHVISVNGQVDYPQQTQQQQQQQLLSATAPSPAFSSARPPPHATPANPSPARTFASTECQTDDIETVQLRSPAKRPSARSRPLPVPPPHSNNTPATPSTPSSAHTREQRRRERRERRHQQHQLQHAATQLPPPHHHPSRRRSERRALPAPPPPPLPQPQPPPPLPPPHPYAHIVPHVHPSHLNPHASMASNAPLPAAISALLRPMLPDILHSHFPPPYSALSAGSVGPSPSGPPPPPTASLGPALLTPVISTVPIQGAATIVSDGRFSLPLPMIRSPSERSGKGCCGQWFAGPPLRALIAVVALGGVACALGGAALGATGLAGPPSSHFTAALLMIGVGVVLVTVSGAAWRMTAPGGPPCLGLGSSVDLGRCGRRPCSRGGGAPHGLLYPEFQHRPPPPSYQASMQEYRLRLLLLDRDRQNGVVRGGSPPPTYRSHAGSLLRAPLTTLRGGGGGGGCGSSAGGSEYSLPPSYRSRNTTTPATICSERSIETAPSGRLLANEDIPEPLSAELLPQYNSLQHLRQLSDLSSGSPAVATPAPPASLAGHQLRTSAIVEIEAPPPHSDVVAVTDDRKPPASHQDIRSSTSATTNGKGKDLVTIVTISSPNHDDVLSSGVENVERQQQQLQHSSDQMQILAHL